MWQQQPKNIISLANDHAVVYIRWHKTWNNMRKKQQQQQHNQQHCPTQQQRLNWKQNEIQTDTPVVTLEFGTNLNTSFIREGADVYFECNIKSNPWVYKVSWRHNVSSLLLFSLCYWAKREIRKHIHAERENQMKKKQHYRSKTTYNTITHRARHTRIQWGTNIRSQNNGDKTTRRPAATKNPVSKSYYHKLHANYAHLMHTHCAHIHNESYSGDRRTHTFISYTVKHSAKDEQAKYGTTPKIFISR